MSQTLKVAVVGVGGIARVHMPGWAASEHTEVVAGCDVNEEILQRWGKEHGIDKLVTDVADLIRDPDIDIIDICTPNNYHAPISIAAMDAASTCCARNPLHRRRRPFGI